jgi:serine/threonine-protein kinase
MPIKPWPPKTLDGRLTLLKPIGKGGYGHVYVAWDPHLTRKVAVKLFRPLRVKGRKAEDAVARFRREARLTGSFESHHIPRVHSQGIDAPTCTPYVVMELLRGQDLAKWVRDNGPMPVRMVVPLLIQAAYGLDAGHRKGIVHLDVKPANLFLHESRDPPFDHIAKVLDFGIVWKKDEGSATPTFFHSTLHYYGTEDFRSPEQVLGYKTYTPASDVFSLGATAVNLLTGARPFRVAELNPLLTASGARAVPPERLDRSMPELRMPSLLGVVPSFSPALDAVLRQALSFDPGSRFQSVDEFAKALAEAWRSSTGEPVPFLTEATREHLAEMAIARKPVEREAGQARMATLPAVAECEARESSRTQAVQPGSDAGTAVPPERIGTGDDLAPDVTGAAPGAIGITPAPPDAVPTPTESGSTIEAFVEGPGGGATGTDSHDFGTRTAGGQPTASQTHSDSTQPTATPPAGAFYAYPAQDKTPLRAYNTLAGPAPAPTSDASPARRDTGFDVNAKTVRDTTAREPVADSPAADAGPDSDILVAAVMDVWIADTQLREATKTHGLVGIEATKSEPRNTSATTNEHSAAGAQPSGAGEPETTIVVAESDRVEPTVVAVSAPAGAEGAHRSGANESYAPHRRKRGLRSTLLLLLALFLLPTGIGMVLNLRRPLERVAEAPVEIGVADRSGPPRRPESYAPLPAEPVATPQAADNTGPGASSAPDPRETDRDFSASPDARRERAQPSRSRENNSGTGRPVFPGQDASPGYYSTDLPRFDYAATHAEVQTALRDADILDFSRDYLGASSLLRRVLSGLQPHRYSSAAAGDWAREIEAKLHQIREHCETIRDDPLLWKGGRPQCPD